LTIHIQALTFRAIIGVLPHERKTPQKIVVDAFISYSYNENDYIDYALVVSSIKKFIRKKRFLLLEDAVSQTKLMIEALSSNITDVKLTIAKPNILRNTIISLQSQY
jgi:dihydroneopterin aldolase